MQNVYPVIQGRKQQHQFHDDWEETPLTAFTQWQAHAISMEQAEKLIDQRISEVKKIVEKYQFHYLKKQKNLANKYLKQADKKNKAIDKLRDELHLLEVDALQGFTTIPLSDLLEMRRQHGDEDMDDNCIDRYKYRLVYLASKPLPTDSVNSFYFQSKTDEEISNMRKILKATPMYKFTERKKLKREIEAAEKTEYKIKDIWEQTTTMNKQLQEVANDIVDEMKEGNYDNLPYLIALLTIEDNVGSEKLSQIKVTFAKSYLEVYMAEVKDVLEHRMKVFYEQEKKLSIATAIRVKNFFLSKSMT